MELCRRNVRLAALSRLLVPGSVACLGACAVDVPPAAEVDAAAARVVPAQVDAAAPAPAPDAARPEQPSAKIPAPAHGRKLGRFQVTYYWIASERRGHRGHTRVLRDPSCRRIARVSTRFARKLDLEGTGRLRDGRLLNVAGHCACHGRCYSIAGHAHRFGFGVHNRPLSPFRSVAVDPSYVTIGERLYIPALDGVRMPGRPPWGGFISNGCVVADDRGGGIRGRQLDFFTASRSLYRALFGAHPLTHVTVYDGAGHCSGAARRGAPPTS